MVSIVADMTDKHTRFAQAPNGRKVGLKAWGERVWACSPARFCLPCGVCRGCNDDFALDGTVQDTSDIVHGSQVDKERAKVGQLGVMRVVEPCRDWHGVVRMENVGSGRIVENNAPFHVPTELRKVLDVVALVIVAALSEKSVSHDAIGIQHVKHRVGILP